MPGPISVEDMLAKQKAEKEAAAKVRDSRTSKRSFAKHPSLQPKFLSKAERAAMALEKRNAEVRVQQEKDDTEKADRIAFEKAAEEERRRQEATRYGQNDGHHDRYGNGRYNDRHGNGRYNDRGQSGYGQNGQRDDRYGQGGPSRGGPPTGPRSAPTAPKSMQNGHGPSPLASSSSLPKPTIPGDAALPTDAELNSIRARYLGQKVVEKKPRLRKEGGANPRNVVFDWKNEDDTSGAESAWAAEVRGQTQALLMNGRSETPNKADEAKQYADPLEKRRAGKGVSDERHWSAKELEAMDSRDWRIMREDFAIAARGGAIPMPLRTWRESTIPTDILDVIDEIGYKEPSPIQRQAIPIGLTNRDLIGIAQTGSGKTAAFLVPALNYISKLPPLSDENRHLGPYALIIAPTRELAQQIQTEALKFTSRLGLTCVGIVGGKDVEGQSWELRNGAEIIVATPGRLRDMLQASKLVLSQCK